MIRMTKKRFTVEPTMIRECIVDNTTGEQLDTFDYTERLCEVLNELNDEVVKGDLFKLTVAMAIQHRINWLKKQIWDNTDRIDELQSLKKELKL